VPPIRRATGLAGKDTSRAELTGGLGAEAGARRPRLVGVKRRRRACAAAPDPGDRLGERSFLPNAVFTISTLLDSSEDAVS
jgi:hypothetical protein